jgi:hypothetical protein
VTFDAFRSNKRIKNLLESQSYLSGEELSLKQELEVSIQKFYQFYDKLIQNKSKLESDVNNHFQEMRFQIDQHREELKKKIDDIALAMIDQTTKNEELYLKNQTLNSCSFDDCKSLQIKLSELEETFRHPNLLVETIREMLQTQEESLNSIQFKLNEMNEVKDKLEGKYEFKPSLTLFTQNEASFFGHISIQLEVKS